MSVSGTIWLIGAGLMARDYFKVLRALGLQVLVIGRGTGLAVEFERNTGQTVIRGGLENFLREGPEKPAAAIVAVGVDKLAETTRCLLRYGVRKILLEKPGAVDLPELKSLSEEAQGQGLEIPLAYNRRFYASVLAAQKMIAEDGGVRSFTFEFTEWGHEIIALTKPDEVLRHWFLANSTHVTDLAFFIGGVPVEMFSHIRESLPWHPAGAIFTGSGVSSSGALFAYQADWAAPGRWGLEIMTASQRYIFRPMEKLQTQKLGSVAIETMGLDYSLDVEFKPGLYLQTKAFLENDLSRFQFLSAQSELAEIYSQMSGYRLV